MNSTSEIWIAEDDRSLRWVMEKAISREGIEVRSFENGDDLLVALRSSLPEIIISDIRMPGIDGLELLKQIHGHAPGYPGDYYHRALRSRQCRGRLSGRCL